MKLKCRDGGFAVVGVALVIAVGEPCCDFAQVAPPDWLTTQRAERLRAGCPAIHQNEFHVPPPKEKQDTVQCGGRLSDGGVFEMKPIELSRSILPSQADESSSSIEITGFGIAISNVAIHARSAQYSKQLCVGRSELCFGLDRLRGSGRRRRTRDAHGRSRAETQRRC